MTTDEIQKAMRKKRTEIGSRIADYPKTAADLRSSLFGEDKTLGSLRENEAAKIKELYEHDKAVASNYVPQTPGFIEDPGAKARFGSDVLARQGGELADIQKGIANRRDVLGDALTKGMEIFTAGLDALKFEYGGMKDERDFQLQLQELAEKRADRAESRGKTAKADTRQKQNDLDADAKAFGSMIDNGVMDWGQAWNELARRFPEFVNPDGTSPSIDAALGGSAIVTEYKDGQPIRKETGRAKTGYTASQSEGITEKKQRVAAEAYKLRFTYGQNIEQVKDYIVTQGLNPQDEEFMTIIYKKK